MALVSDQGLRPFIVTEVSHVVSMVQAPDGCKERETVLLFTVQSEVAQMGKADRAVQQAG